MSGPCEDTDGGGGVAVCIIKIDSQLNCSICACIFNSHSTRLRMKRDFAGNRHCGYVGSDKQRKVVEYSGRQLRSEVVAVMPVNWSARVVLVGGG